jgi:hypothetical protein
MKVRHALGILFLSFLFIGGAFSSVVPSVYAQTGDSSPKAAAAPPQLNIPVPGLDFGTGVEDSGYLVIPFIGQYVSAVYKYLVGVGVIAAAVMIVYGGFLYVLGSTISKISSGKEIITDAIIGLVLLLGSYSLLALINPMTTNLSAVKIRKITPVDADYLEKNGTGDPVETGRTMERLGSEEIPGEDRNTVQPSTTDNSVERVDISKIPFSRADGGPANINKFCTSKAKAKSAETYEKKILYLVQAVLGFEKTCVQNGQCAYCQTCGTSIPSGTISPPNPDLNFAANFFIKRGVSPAELWSGNAECVRAWNKEGEYAEKGKGGGWYMSANMPQCKEEPAARYRDKYVAGLMENKIYGTDCGSFVWNVLNCAGVDWKKPPTEKACNGTKCQNTPYMSIKSVGQFTDLPGMIVNARMDEDINAIAAQKGGIKFGDIVYTNCAGDGGAYGLHFSLYTGGRPDVPFSFIEMGAGPERVKIPGVGGVGGVNVHPANETLQDLITAKITASPFKNSKGKVLWMNPPKCKPHESMVIVWRPYAD